MNARVRALSRCLSLCCARWNRSIDDGGCRACAVVTRLRIITQASHALARTTTTTTMTTSRARADACIQRVRRVSHPATSTTARRMRTIARADDSADDFIAKLAARALRTIGGTVADVLNAGNDDARASYDGFPAGPREDVALELGYDPLMFLEDASATYGDAVGLRLANARVVLVSSPALAKKVLMCDAVDGVPEFQKEGTAFFPGSSLAGNGLLVSDGETWARQRRLSNPAFRKAAVETYAKCMVDVGAKIIARDWSRRGVRDVYADFNDATLEIVARALFGADVEGARAATINRAIKDSFEFFGRRAATGMIIPEWAPTFDNVRYNEAVKRLDEEVYGIIAKRRRATARGEEHESLDLLDRLLRATDEGDGSVDGVGDGGGMTDKALRDELMTLMVAGQETSAILLSWACALVAEHPNVGDRIADEVREVLRIKGTGSTLDAGDFSKLPYTEACVLETLRIRPPAYMVGRCAARDVELRPGVRVTKGTTVLVAPYLIQRDPKYWNDPVAFRPERWLVQSPYSDGALARDALKSLGPNDAYFPFGGGARVCIGTGFAMLESVLLLGMVCSACEMRLPPNSGPPKPKALITLRPESIELEIRPRPRKV